MFEPPPLCLLLNRWDPDGRAKLLLAFSSIRYRRSLTLPEKTEVDLYEQERWRSEASPAAVCLTRNQYDTDVPKENWILFHSLPNPWRKPPSLGCEQVKSLPARQFFSLHVITTPNVFSRAISRKYAV
jgi:hypothetical protein